MILVIFAPTKEGWATQKNYIVRLTDTERETLKRLIQKRHVASQKVRRAQVLLKADANGPSWTDVEIAEAFDCRTWTLKSILEHLVIDGFEIALNDKPKSRARGKVIDGVQEAKIIALLPGQPPKKFANWILALGRTSRGTENHGIGQPRDPASDAIKQMTKKRSSIG